MKRIIALTLFFVMCFSLVACFEGNGDGAGKFNLYQEWKHVLLGSSLTFHKGGNATIYGGEYKYEYDKKLEQVSLHAKITFNLPISSKDGIYILGSGESCFVPADKYEEFHAEALKKAYGDKTVISVGESYKFTNGLEVRLNKVECTDKKSGSYKLNFTCRNTVSEDIEILTENVPLICYDGNAFIATEFDWNADCTIEGNKIPANSSKDIVVSVKPGVDLDLDESEYGYILIGFTHEYYGSHDYEDGFNGFYVNVFAALND